MSNLTVVFKWVLYSSVMASILAGVIILLKWLIKDRLGVRWQYGVWFLVMLRLIIPYAPQSNFSAFNLFYIIGEKNNSPVSIIITAWEDHSPATSIAVKPENKPITTVKEDIPSTDQTSNTDNGSFSYISIAVLLWLLGIIALGSYTLAATIQFWRKVRMQEAFNDENILKIISECKNKLKLKTDIIMHNTKLVKTPAVFGFFRPRLLLPVGIEKHLSSNELKYIIYHELSHIKRKDILLNCIISALRIIHWFNPILWYSFYRIRQDSELECDALAMSHIDQSECKKYGATIIKLLETLSKDRSICGMAGMVEDKSQIKKRIKMISKFKKGSYKWPVMSILILIAMGFVLLTNAQGFRMNKSENTLTEALSESSIKADNQTPDNNDVRGKVVVIDPGHGGKDAGAVYQPKKSESNNTMVQEKDLNLEISLLLYDMLQKSGVTVELTRKADVDIGLAERADLANKLNASLFVSVHINAGPNGEESGASTMYDASKDFYRTHGISTERTAHSIQQEMINQLGMTDGGLREANNLVILKNTKMPSIVAEAGYITNNSDRQNLMTEEYREKVAKALHDGIVKVLSEEKDK